MKRWASAVVLTTAALVGCGTQQSGTTASGGGSAAGTTAVSGDVTLVKLKLPGMT